MVATQNSCWRKELSPELAKQGIRFLSFSQLIKTDRLWLQNYFRLEVFPVLTPLAIDSAHPFPQLSNRTLNLMVRLDSRVRRSKWHAASGIS